MSVDQDEPILRDLLAFGKAAIKRICPEFSEEIALDMGEAYWVDPEFIGTVYQHQTKMIEAFHLHKELKYLAQRR